MPYIIETRYSDCDFPGSCGECDISRIAVATLDEARRITAREYREHVHRFMGFDTRWITESGGTIGPLPDGTVIEVRTAAWQDLAPWPQPTDPPYRADIIAAFNGAHA